VTFESVTEQAIKNNLELQLYDVEKELSIVAVKEVDNLSYPKLTTTFDTYFKKDLSESQSIFTPQDKTQYISTAEAEFQYTLIDFGVRDTQKSIAMFDTDIIKHSKNQKIIELKLKLLKLYQQIVQTQKEYIYYQNIIKLYSKIYEDKKRLYDIHKIDKISLANSAIDLIETKKQSAQSKNTLLQVQKELTIYTKNEYNENTIFEDITLQKVNNTNYEQTPLHLEYQEKIKQKTKEIQLASKERFPTINLYGNYNLYKSDYDKWSKSLGLEERNYIIGLSLSLTLFDSYIYDTKKRKLQLQIKKLQLENELQKEKYILSQSNLSQEVVSLDEEIHYSKINQTKHQDTLRLQKNLQDKKLSDSISSLEKEIQQYKIDLNLDLNKLTQIIKLKQMQIQGLDTSVISVVKKTKPKNIYKVKVDSANLRDSPFINSSKIIGSIPRDTLLDIEFCNSYGWCKLVDEEKYIARFLLIELQEFGIDPQKIIE
jgi:outer membrane protein TolC